jgi:hypothetical protein
MPTPVRVRRIEQKVQALKERAWQIKARIGMLKEQTLGGGVGSQLVIVHDNDMGTAFRLVGLTYTLDGAQILSRTDDAETSLYKTKALDVLSGPISPGNHTLSVVAVYRGYGYGVLSYMSAYKFTVSATHAFTVAEGKMTRVEGVAHEIGSPATPIEKRAALDFKVSTYDADGGNGAATPVIPATPGAPAPMMAPSTPPATPSAPSSGASGSGI